MRAHVIDINELTGPEAAVLHAEVCQKWLQQTELCFFLVRIEHIEAFPIKMKYALRRYQVEDVGDLLQVSYRDLGKMDQIGQKGKRLILEYLLTITCEMFML